MLTTIAVVVAEGEVSMDIPEGAVLEDGVLLTGSFGSGKSTVAVEIADLLERRGTPYALIDLDFLGWFGTGRPTDAGDDADHDDLSPLLLANLAAVAANYRRAGIGRFVLAHTVDSLTEVQEIRAALDAPLRVVRLDVPLEVIERRLGADPTAGRRDDLRRAGVWLAQGRGHGLPDLAVSNERPVRQVALEILAWLGWL